MKKIILISLGIYLFTSCKKDTSTTAGNFSEIISPSNATSYYSIFTIQKNDILSPSSFIIQTIYNSSVYFSSSPVVSANSATAVTVDSIKFNGILFDHYPNGFVYSDTNITTPINNYSPGTWHVVGNNGIPSFTYTDNTHMPTYTGYNLLPDTIDHTKALTITISNVTNSSEISVWIGNNGGYISQNLASGSSSITFSASFMAQLTNSGSGSISVMCTKNNVQNVYGKAMNFQSVYSLQKEIFIK